MRSPNSSSWRCGESSARSSLNSSATLSKTVSGESQSNPARLARPRAAWAYASAGIEREMPSSMDLASSPFAARSSALRCSHWPMASSDVCAEASPNTCGWRRTSFVLSCVTMSSIVNSRSSDPIWAWKMTWSSTSPSSSMMWARSPEAIASSASYVSSRRRPAQRGMRLLRVPGASALRVPQAAHRFQ